MKLLLNMLMFLKCVYLWLDMCALFCRSLACAAMLMYDYPLKTDMETVRHVCLSKCSFWCLSVCVCVCVCVCVFVCGDHA